MYGLLLLWPYSLLGGFSHCDTGVAGDLTGSYSNVYGTHQGKKIKEECLHVGDCFLYDKVNWISILIRQKVWRL